MKPLSSYIDHTLLAPTAGRDDILRICAEARALSTASVCVNSCNVSLVHEALLGSGVKTCSVVGFPLGAMSTAGKAAEARQAVIDGADEIDMVINLGFLKSGDLDAVQQDIAAVVSASKPALVKVIIETCLLTQDEKVLACKAAKAAGAAFVKTSTGFSTGGATAEDVQLMRQTVGPDLGVKASGGVRTREQALQMIQAGASRIGASASKAIIEG